jgi:hypothetical protein
MIILVASQAGVCSDITSGACLSRGVSFSLLCHTSCSIKSSHVLINLTSCASEECRLSARGYVELIALSLFTVVARLPEEVNNAQVKHASSLASFLSLTTNTRTASVRGCLVAVVHTAILFETSHNHHPPQAQTNTNMFSRSDNNLPEDVSFPADLTQLGLKRDLRGRYVQIDDEDEFDYYEHYTTKATNDKRYEAVHEAIRHDVYGMLGKMGVKLIYTHDKDVSVTTKIPEEKPKIKMLHGGLETVSNEFYVIIGDSRRELGIISRMTTSIAGGPREGTVLGVARALQTHGEWDGPPTMLVLNPGELLYSYESKSCMTQDTWNTRKLPHAFAEQFAVKDANKVPGHTTPQEHVKTVLDDILPQLVKAQHKSLHIIAIGDGGESVLKYLDEKLTDDPNAKIAKLALVSLALVNSSHDGEELQIPQLKKFMAKHGRAWVSSAEPKNKILGKVAPEFRQYTQDQDDDGNASSDTESSVMSGVFAKRPIGRARAVSSLSEGLKEQKRTSGPHNDITRIRESVFYSSMVSEDGSATSSELGIKLPPLISDRYPSMSVPGLTMKEYRKACDGGPEQKRRVSATMHDTTLANPYQYRISMPSKPIPIPNPTNSVAYHNARAREIRKFSDAKKALDGKKAAEDKKAADDKAARKAKRAAEVKAARDAKARRQELEDELIEAEREMNDMAIATGQRAHFRNLSGDDFVPQVLYQSNDDFVYPSYAHEAAALADATTPPPQAYDYYGKPCVCTTVSAGLEDVTEQLFPAVRQDVLEFAFEQQRRKQFKWRMRELRERDLKESVASMGLQESVDEA